jgi:hypothetical protein
MKEQVDTIENGEIKEISKYRDHRGGARPNSGRKPKAATIAKNRLIADKIGEAQASFAFLVAVRDNEDEPTEQRASAARWIYECVHGKANQGLMIDAVVDDATRLTADARRERITELERRRGSGIPAVATGG